MDRINSSNTIDIGAGKRGFRDRNALLALAGTIVNAAFLNASQEEILALIEGAGLTPSAGNLGQALQAVRRMAGSNVTLLTANTTLTPDHAGVVILNATGGNFAVTLPAANAAAGLPIRYQFLSAASGTVTIQRAGSDLIETLTSLAIVPVTRLELVSNGASWAVAGETQRRRLLAQTGYEYRAGGMLVQWGVSASGAGGLAPVAFPMPFAENPFSLDVREANAVGWGSPPQPTIHSYIDLTPTIFTAVSIRFSTTGVPSYDAGVAFRWRAEGRAA